MASSKRWSRGLILAAVLMGSGCSWFHHHRREAVEPAQASAPEAAAALGIAPVELAPDAQALSEANKLASDFYEMHERLGRSGLPDESAMKAYRAFVCPALATAMDSARARQAQYIAAHPQDKPPLVEGDLFSSLFEGPDSVVVAGTEADGGGARVTMSMR
ncbi:MAG: hypothetical protein ABI588_10875, partial [Arenimonas sp.]